MLVLISITLLISPPRIPDRCRIDQDIHLLAVLGGNHLFGLVNLPVLKGLFHRAGYAFLGAVHIHLVALAAEEIPEILPEAPVGLDDLKIPVLDGDITGNLLKELAVPLPALPELILQKFDLGDIGGHFHDGGDLPGLVPDGRGIDDQRDFLPGEILKLLLDAMALSHRGKSALLGNGRIFPTDAY